MINIPFLNKPIAWILGLCYKIIPSYAVALFFFALIMKVILFPTGIKQQKNMVKQATLRPKEEAIRKRYAGRTDKATQQKMQEEIMKLYQKENYNPMGGCLPMILQLVIILALYNVINSPLQYVCHIDSDNIYNIAVEAAELYKADELKVEGLSETTVKQIKSMADQIGEDGSTAKVKNAFPYDLGLVNVIRLNGVDKFIGEGMLPDGFTEKNLPDFTVFGGAVDLSATPSVQEFGLLWLIPLLTFVFTFGSMKLTRKFTYQPTQAAGDAALSMKMMDFVMPLISTFFTFQVPAVIAVYWIYQNVLSTVQQLVLKLMYPYPTFTEEDYKAADREMNKGIKPSNKAVKRAAKRAAHRIDLDDAAETADTVSEDVASAPAIDAPKAEKGSDLIPPAVLKDESDKDGTV